MKPTTLSFLGAHLQKAPPFIPTPAHHKCSTNNASSSLLLPIHSHNCTSQMLNQQRFFLAPPHSQSALATTTLLVATALNEIVISNMKESRLPASCKAQDFKTHCGLGRANNSQSFTKTTRESRSLLLSLTVRVAGIRSCAQPLRVSLRVSWLVITFCENKIPGSAIYNHGLKLHYPFIRAGFWKRFSLKSM
jgi:hypothetical protein